MVGHIYGQTNILIHLHLDHVFINELKIYMDYFKKGLEDNLHLLTNKKENYFEVFKNNLDRGIAYYRTISSSNGKRCYSRFRYLTRRTDCHS